MENGEWEDMLGHVCIINYQLPITFKPLALALFKSCLRHAVLCERLVPVKGAQCLQK
jgi:hypothetical protein